MKMPPFAPNPNSEPEPEEFSIDEWKMLFMLLCENRANLELTKGLTPFGQSLLFEVQRKIGIQVVGVATTKWPKVPMIRCSTCDSPLISEKKS